METKKLCSRRTRKGNLTCKFTVKVLVLHVVLHVCCTCVARALHGNSQGNQCWPAAALMTVGFWQAQPGLVHRQCVAVLLPESRAAILMRSHLHAEVVEVQHATCRRLHVDIPLRCGRHFDEVTSACKSCWKYNMTFARVNRWTSISLKNSPRVLQKKTAINQKLQHPPKAPGPPVSMLLTIASQWPEQKWLFFLKAPRSTAVTQH